MRVTTADEAPQSGKAATRNTRNRDRKYVFVLTISVDGELLPPWVFVSQADAAARLFTIEAAAEGLGRAVKAQVSKVLVVQPGVEPPRRKLDAPPPAAADVEG